MLWGSYLRLNMANVLLKFLFVRFIFPFTEVSDLTICACITTVLRVLELERIRMTQCNIHVDIIALYH